MTVVDPFRGQSSSSSSKRPLSTSTIGSFDWIDSVDRQNQQQQRYQQVFKLAQDNNTGNSRKRNSQNYQQNDLERANPRQAKLSSNHHHRSMSSPDNSISASDMFAGPDNDEYRQILARSTRGAHNNNNQNQNSSNDSVFNSTTTNNHVDKKTSPLSFRGFFNMRRPRRPPPPPATTRKSHHDDDSSDYDQQEQTTTSSSGSSGRESSVLLDACCVGLWRLTCFMSVLLLLWALIYFWPIGANYQVEPKTSAPRPRPRFAGPLAINRQLDELGERLFEEQFHAPESMAWTRDRRAFYTGVEGGFILYVEPYAERWSVAARLNARQRVADRTAGVKFMATKQQTMAEVEYDVLDNQSTTSWAPFCETDVGLYGRRAEFEPSLVRLSRCSRPLGVRLAPNETYLYVIDPLSGLFRVDLLAEAGSARARADQNQVSKLIDFTRFGQERAPDASQAETRIIFGDDIAVDWAAASTTQTDVIYMTDCSQRWTLRYLLWLMLENDDSGRILTFDTAQKTIRPLGSVTPVKVQRQLNISIINNNNNNNRDLANENVTTTTTTSTTASFEDHRGLSFPNGIEFTANGSSLLISDLNNRRILMHHLRGPLSGTTSHLMWIPGYPDNIKRGLDEPDGSPTYWYACGCAVDDGKFEMAEFFNEAPIPKKILLKFLHLVGSALDWLGEWLQSTPVRDAGLMIDAAWLKYDPYCRHGLVAQFNEQGQVLRSLHGPQYNSRFKILSEAHQVALPDENSSSSTSSGSNTTSTMPKPARSALYLGSVYYSYLGRLELPAISAATSTAAATTTTTTTTTTN